MFILPSLFIYSGLSNHFQRKVFILNTNDLRYLKTEKILKDSYYTIKKKRAPINLAMLCKEAMINKSTFYKHYETLETFEHTIRKEYIKEILYQSDYIDCAFDNTRMYYTWIVNAIDAHWDEIEILFSDDYSKVTDIIEEVVLDRYSKRGISEEQKLIIKFITGGSTRTMLYSNKKEAIDVISQIMEKITIK